MANTPLRADSACANPTSRRAVMFALPAMPLALSGIPAIASSGGRTGWERAISDFHAASDNLKRTPGDDETVYEAATTLLCDTLRAVSAYPVTTIGMLQEKLDLLVTEYGIDDMGAGDEFHHIYADVKRLAGAA